jgi:hypothetical protein
METDDEKPTSESSSTDSSEPQSTGPRIKLRDLRPEKDPMGAGHRPAPAAPQREI